MAKKSVERELEAEDVANACLYRNSNDIAGYCSKTCNSFAECPVFWDCKALANAAGTYCVQ